MPGILIVVFIIIVIVFFTFIQVMIDIRESGGNTYELLAGLSKSSNNTKDSSDNSDGSNIDKSTFVTEKQKKLVMLLRIVSGILFGIFIIFFANLSNNINTLGKILFWFLLLLLIALALILSRYEKFIGFNKQTTEKKTKSFGMISRIIFGIIGCMLIPITILVMLEFGYGGKWIILFTGGFSFLFLYIFFTHKSII